MAGRLRPGALAGATGPRALIKRAVLMIPKMENNHPVVTPGLWWWALIEILRVLAGSLTTLAALDLAGAVS